VLVTVLWRISGGRAGQVLAQNEVPIETCTCKSLVLAWEVANGSKFEMFREAWDHLRAPVADVVI
jgi:hypothetical protein